MTQVVNEAATSTTISADTNPSVSGETVNYTATVSVTPPGSDSTPPTGTVDFEYSANAGATWNAITGCSAQVFTWSSTSHTGTGERTRQPRGGIPELVNARVSPLYGGRRPLPRVYPRDVATGFNPTG